MHDYCTQTYINLHKLLTLHCNFICVLSVVIIKTDDDDDDDDDEGEDRLATTLLT